MKRNIVIGSLITLMGISAVGASSVEDDSILKELNKENTQEISTQNFQFKKFESCEDLESVTSDFLKDYNGKYSRGGIMYKNIGMVPEMMVDDVAFDEAESVTSNSVAKSAVGGDADFSETNEQVAGVSESEIIKTDGEFIYYMSDYYDRDEGIKNYTDRQKKNVFVIDSNTMKVVKKIKLPKHFWGTQLYLQDDKLVIIASGSPSGTFQKRYWDSSSKTYSIIYDITTPAEAQLVKVYMTEGSFSKSRLIDNKLYVISRKDMYNYFRVYNDEISLEADDIVPKGLEIIATKSDDEQNVDIDGKKLDYKVTSGFVAGCNDIEYILPDGDSDLGYPQFNLVSTIDIDDLEDQANTKVIFGNLNEIYMSLDNLYMTNSVYKTEAFRCPVNARCISPFYYGGTNHTLIHKLNVTDDDLEYQTSALVEGSPLTQYSMDEYKDNFRILTKTNRWNSNGQEAHTDLYVLDEDLKLKSSLQGLGGGEDFKSSRYIGDKLFLVTFEQIDPLFVIDLADATDPKILGELKMPGYSTYLHPYDQNHIIGLGYDTKQNQWGGTQNNGIKVDLYEIDYDRKPESKDNSGDIYVAQKYSKVFGENGSYSEALNNPRMFMWNGAKNTLLLPMNIRTNSQEDTYKAIDFFQGLVSIDIDKDSGIDENYRITHISTDNLEEERKLECSKYSQNQEEQECKTLIDGSKYCPVKSRYVPQYCYAESTIGEYFASKSWNYSSDFIKRAIWIGDEVYTISDKQIKKSDLESGTIKNAVDLK